MKDAMKTLLSHTPKGAMEDLVGVASLFVLLFAVLSVPGLHSGFCPALCSPS